MEGDGNSELVAMFTSRWPVSAATSPKGQLRVALANAAKAAAAAWPTVRIASERFIGYLTERADSSLPPLEAIENLHRADLYFACGVAIGEQAAVDIFLATFGQRLRAVIGIIDSTTAFVDQVMDELRTALLGDALLTGREGKIAQYRGRFPLADWLEASATRRAVTLTGSAKPFDDLAEIATFERARPPQLDHLRLRYPNGFGQAVRDGTSQAVTALSRNDRLLLRSHLIDGFSLRKLSHIRGVNVNVIARDYALARAAILRQIQVVLGTGTGLSPDDAAAVMNALFTRVNLGINATLKASPT